MFWDIKIIVFYHGDGKVLLLMEEKNDIMRS